MATIFTLQNPSPRNEVRDMSINQTFSGIVDGVRYTDYQLFIYKISDNSLVYNSTKLALTPNLPDGALWEHIVPSGSVTNSATESYKWRLQTWNGAENVTTREFPFTARTTPILTFTPPSTITTQSYEFTATLTQAEGDIPNNYTFELYDNTQTLVESSGLITNFNILYSFSGFSNGDELGVRILGTTTGGQLFDSGLITFDVVYSEPDINLKPDATVDNTRGTITVTRGEAIQIIGTSSGTISYLDDFLYAGNTALSLADSSSSASFNVDIPIDFTLSFKWQPDSNSFEGKIIQLDDGAYEVGYELGAFYYTINGVTQYSLPVDLYGSVFYIVLQPQSCSFAKTELFNQWNDIPFGTTWIDLTGQTWEDIGLI